MTIRRSEGGVGARISRGRRSTRLRQAADIGEGQQARVAMIVIEKYRISRSSCFDAAVLRVYRKALCRDEPQPSRVSALEGTLAWKPASSICPMREMIERGESTDARRFPRY